MFPRSQFVPRGLTNFPYVFMAVGACIKATAFSMECIGGARDFAFASAFIGSKRFIYMIDLQCGRLNSILGGSALGSIGLVWGGTALLDALSYLSSISFKSAILAP